MAISRVEYPDLGIDIEVEILSAAIKFFPHKNPRFFGQGIVNTVLLNQAVFKGLETHHMPFRLRKNLSEAVRRTLKQMGYKNGFYQRKKCNKTVTVEINLN
jgi:hypothetical protein